MHAHHGGQLAHISHCLSSVTSEESLIHCTQGLHKLFLTREILIAGVKYNILCCLNNRSDKSDQQVKEETSYGWKPLHYILERKDTELVRLLVSKGAGKFFPFCQCIACLYTQHNST